MIDSVVKTAVRTRFALTRRDQANRQIARAAERYIAVGESIGPREGRRPVRVPRMLGVDEDMREWSFFMILEHNTIVNRSITAIVQCLARGEEPSGPGAIDPKVDVMPSPGAGAEQMGAFRLSVGEHLDAVARLPRLRETRTKRHPVFDELDAHGWHCMFGLHLDIHLRQAEAARRMLSSNQDPTAPGR